jgi:acyl carrier protein
VGELYVGGACLARGYWNEPRLTKERFLRDPFSPVPESRLYRTGDLGRFLPNGNIELLGRLDRQLKLRGHRLEPDDIEYCLRQHPSIRNAAVGLRETAVGTSLVAWCECTSHNPLETAEMSHYLSHRLPRFMIPTHWIFLDTMPLTPGGKIDYAVLPAPVDGLRNGRSTPEPPSNMMENKIASIWEELLSIRSIGIHENFFDIGGHSLLAAKLAARMSSELGRDVPLAKIFRSPTIAELARTVNADTSTSLTVV